MEGIKKKQETFFFANHEDSSVCSTATTCSNNTIILRPLLSLRHERKDSSIQVLKTKFRMNSEAGQQYLWHWILLLILGAAGRVSQRGQFYHYYNYELFVTPCQAFVIHPQFRVPHPLPTVTSQGRSQPFVSQIMATQNPESSRRETASKPRNRGTRSSRTNSSRSSPETALERTAPQKPTSRKASSWAMSTYAPLLEHRILKPDQERRLGTAIQRARHLHEQILQRNHHQERTQTTDESSFSSSYVDTVDEEEDEDEYANLSIFKRYRNTMEDETDFMIEDGSSSMIDDYFSFLETKAQPSLLNEENSHNSLGPQSWTEEKHFVNMEKLLMDLTHNDIRELGYNSVDEIQQVLAAGSGARDTLIRSNIRLVVSIAKKWAKQTAKSSKGPNAMSSVYAGGWDRPSLDEAVQEGIFGLAKAADRFDPSRKLRFATYATHWVTNYVRQCYRTASTGCLRVPSGFHEARTKYRKLSKDYYEVFGELPTVDFVAEQMNMTPKRLRLILDRTRPLLSTDAPFALGSITQAGKAGNNEGEHMLVSDTLVDTEAEPSEFVELSFLRQSLENAMASELAPHERDIVRLRLGLDDGVSRTAREVAEYCGGTVSVSDVRTTEKRAFKKLRSPRSLASYKLLAYLDFADADETTMTLR